MTFNIWVGGEAGKQPLSQTAQVLRASGADVVGMQEVLGRDDNGERPDNGAVLAKLLGWNYASQGNGRAILSEFEIVGLTPGRHGAELRLPSGTRVVMFNVHLNHAPYQPYQLLRIPYADAPFLSSADELVAAAHAARGHELDAVIDEMEAYLQQGIPVVLTGDFNEPSHQDWTVRAVEAGHAPLVVSYPTTRKAVAIGMRDAYRAIYPDEVAYRGLTWTPTTSIHDPNDRHDRIDFVFVSSAIRVELVHVIGEHDTYADIVVDPYPSDHRAVAATLSVSIDKRTTSNNAVPNPN